MKMATVKIVFILMGFIFLTNFKVFAITEEQGDAVVNTDSRSYLMSQGDSFNYSAPTYTTPSYTTPIISEPTSNYNAPVYTVPSSTTDYFNPQYSTPVQAYEAVQSLPDNYSGSVPVTVGNNTVNYQMDNGVLSNQSTFVPIQNNSLISNNEYVNNYQDSISSSPGGAVIKVTYDPSVTGTSEPQLIRPIDAPVKSIDNAIDAIAFGTSVGQVSAPAAVLNNSTEGSYPGMGGFYLSVTKDGNPPEFATAGVIPTKAEYETQVFIDNYLPKQDNEYGGPQLQRIDGLPYPVDTRMLIKSDGSNAYLTDTSKFDNNSIIQPIVQLADSNQDFDVDTSNLGKDYLAQPINQSNDSKIDLSNMRLIPLDQALREGLLEGTDFKVNEPVKSDLANWQNFVDLGTRRMDEETDKTYTGNVVMFSDGSTTNVPNFTTREEGRGWYKELMYEAADKGLNYTTVSPQAEKVEIQGADGSWGTVWVPREAMLEKEKVNFIGGYDASENFLKNYIREQLNTTQPTIQSLSQSVTPQPTAAPVIQPIAPANQDYRINQQQ